VFFFPLLREGETPTGGGIIIIIIIIIIVISVMGERERD